MLIIIKQMLIEEMQTFKEFTESDEAVSTSILTLKLKCLESFGLVERKNHPTNKKTKLYHLTEKGLSLAPVLVELAIWSDKNLREFNPIMRQSDELEFMKNNRADLVVLDMIMDPGIDGLDTYRRILEMRPGTKAIIASGFTENERARETIRLGAGEYIMKPYTLRKIGAAVRAELGRDPREKRRAPIS